MRNGKWFGAYGPRGARRWGLTLLATVALAAPGYGARGTEGARAPGRAREKMDQLLDLSGALRKKASEDDVLAAYQDQLTRLDETARETAALLERAEIDAAGAWVKMACYTAWIVSREATKKGASLRLIELTRATGKAGEVERYQARHQMLLDTIRDANERYAAILSELAALPDAAVEEGFRRHEQDLIHAGLAENLRILNKVKAHEAQLPGDLESLAATWQQDLEEL